MDDLMGVHVVTGANELNHKEPGFWFSESASAAQHVHERTRRAKLKCHVDVVGVFEAFLEIDDVGVLERAVDFDFCVKLTINKR
jgi:hypothetical protein